MVYTVEEIRKLLKVNERKVLGWIHSGQLEAFNVGEGEQRPRYRITQKALDQFIESRKKHAQPSKPRRRKKPSFHVWVK